MYILQKKSYFYALLIYVVLDHRFSIVFIMSPPMHGRHTVITLSGVCPPVCLSVRQSVCLSKFHTYGYYLLNMHCASIKLAGIVEHDETELPNIDQGHIFSVKHATGEIRVLEQSSPSTYHIISKSVRVRGFYTIKYKM